MKVFVVTPHNGYFSTGYPWFAFGASDAEVKARFPGCVVKEVN